MVKLLERKRLSTTFLGKSIVLKARVHPMLKLTLVAATFCILTTRALTADFTDIDAAKYGSDIINNAFGYAPETSVPKVRIFKRVEASGHYCVRTCDGRYFPAPLSTHMSRTEGCKNFCPSAETKLFSGDTIEDAKAADGKSYRSTPNAFRYRDELVANCTCNGKAFGLASIAIKDDKTLKSGDLVANDQGKLVNARKYASTKVRVAGSAK